MRKRYILSEELIECPIVIGMDDDGLIAPASVCDGPLCDEAPDIADAEERPQEREDSAIEAEESHLEDIGVTQMLSALIQEEWKAIDAYKSAMATLQGIEGRESEVRVLEDIVSEELSHVGQLEACLKGSAPEASAIDAGNEEGEAQMSDAEATIGESLARGGAKPLNEEYIDSRDYWKQRFMDEIEYMMDDEYISISTGLSILSDEQRELLASRAARDFLGNDYIWDEITETIQNNIRVEYERHQEDYTERAAEIELEYDVSDNDDGEGD